MIKISNEYKATKIFLYQWLEVFRKIFFSIFAFAVFYLFIIFCQLHFIFYYCNIIPDHCYTIDFEEVAVKFVILKKLILALIYTYYIVGID